ncbi:MAG: hypothetical protein K9J12_13725 [Melioribacteraceae bacterium]|nr:hypothetical protein [Melioribacteraceae bacterium]MCF8263177.1 hypothetical protein [Melioribacteraceae bacterium]MCF8414045.1 hypothetical protein [Melioribacteraceae bacterium]MCF8430335.1 hypothetical protein [Melioribacteraceae bacterium]
MKKALLVIFFFAVIVGCSSSSTFSDSAKVLQVDSPSTFHKPVSMRVAWYPYENKKLIETGTDTYELIADSTGGGLTPVILLETKDGGEPIRLDMNIDNELLGKLLKHSLMTEEPITRPFKNYFENTKCSTCHPSAIEIDE